jgi:anti-sigma regulatory factor (Ser/Thr protein kinase)
MTSKLNPFAIRQWAIDAVLSGNDGRMSRSLVERFNVTRMTATRALQSLILEGWLESSGGTRPTYRLGRNRQVVKTYTLPGVDESIAWVHDFAPRFDLPASIANIAHYGLTEMVNNANDHSEGKYVTAAMTLRDGRLSLMVMDDGIGIFEKITKAMSLPDRRLAILELSKGKFTTDPSRHSGEGIFFTSRMFDQFQIEANDLHYDHDIRDKHDWLLEIERPDTGTLLYMSIPADSQRTTKEVFDVYSSGDDYGFHKTVVPVRLAKVGNENLVSRSQAKRLVARFEGFKTVLLDFTGIDEIGQAFADEVFRIFGLLHPDVELIPINTEPPVQQMVNRALAVKMIALNGISPLRAVGQGLINSSAPGLERIPSEKDPKGLP